MAKGTVCLTFDFDAISLWLARGMTTATPISRGEFGATAIPRILHFLAGRKLPSTWFIPGHTIATFPTACRAIVEAGHEIALHGYLHENNAGLELAQERGIFERAITSVEQLTGQHPKGFRSPSWDLSSNTVGLLEEFEIRYDSSLMSQDYSPFYCRKGDAIAKDGTVRFGSVTSIVELPVSWSLDDYPHFEYLRTAEVLMPGLRTVDHVFKNWSDDVHYMARDIDDGICVITLHPQVIGRGHRLLALEKWVDELLDMGMTFGRLDQVAEQFAGGRAFGTYRPTV